MSVAAVLAPLFVQVALTFALLVWMVVVRTEAVRRGEARLRDTALGDPNWPPRVRQISNCFRNQFELPLLFYVLVVLSYVLRKADYVFVVAAWIFVASRLVHAFIHTGSNAVPRRFMAFLVGAVVLLLMWALFAARILLSLA